MSFQIKTERLLIRDIREADIPVLISYYTEPIAQEYILSDQENKTYNRSKLENSIAWAKVPNRTFYDLAVTLNSNNTLIGSCSIREVYPKSIEASLGWHYGSKFWGNGYATEAAHSLLFIGFKVGKVESIYADCFAENKASIRVMEKIGMKPFLNMDFFNRMRGLSYGENKRTIRYHILRNQWLKK